MRRNRPSNAFPFLLCIPMALACLAAPAAAESARSSAEANEEAPETQASGSSTDFAEDLRVQGYVFGGATSMSNVGSALIEIGGGGDYVFDNGIGIGGELSALSDGTGGFAALGVNLSYHFPPEAPGPEPFVSGGMSFGSPVESGLEGYEWASLGAGVNFWTHKGFAIRLEARGRYDLEYDDHTVGIRIGLTF